MKYPTEPRRLTETRLEWQTQPGLVQVQGRGRRKHHQAKRWHRSKRSISTPRHVEALVVADTTMMAFHQDGDVETYLLTIMNMVSALYLDPTIGNFINIVVVRIILVEEEDAEVFTAQNRFQINYAINVQWASTSRCIKRLLEMNRFCPSKDWTSRSTRTRPYTISANGSRS